MMKIKEKTYLRSDIFRLFLYITNFLIILYLASIIRRTTALINWEDDAREFLEILRYIPISPSKVNFATMIMYGLLLLTVLIREFLIPGEGIGQLVFTFLDLILCIGIMYFLNMSNKGLLLIPIVHVVSYHQGKTKKLVLILLIILLYIMVDREFVSQNIFPMISIDDYINYQQTTVRLSMNSIRNILFSSNEVLFILYVIFTIQQQIEETHRVQDLNSALNESLMKLKVSNIQLKEYAGKSEELAKLKERNRLAREIHDTVGHCLTGIELGLKACRDIPDNMGKMLRSQIDKVYELSRKGMTDIRYSLKELRPDALQRYSLVPAIKSLVQQITDFSSLECQLEIQGGSPSLSASLEELIYRIVQESITNAVRHGHASSIEILLVFSETDISLTIHDNGRGSDEVVEGFGLGHIRQRINFFKGTMDHKTTQNQGFDLIVSLPQITRIRYDQSTDS